MAKTRNDMHTQRVIDAGAGEDLGDG